MFKSATKYCVSGWNDQEWICMLIVHMYLVKNYFLFFDNQITFDVFPLNSFVCLIFYHCGPTTVCARCLVVWYFTEFLFISFYQVIVLRILFWNTMCFGSLSYWIKISDEEICLNLIALFLLNNISKYWQYSAVFFWESRESVLQGGEKSNIWVTQKSWDF